MENDFIWICPICGFSCHTCWTTYDWDEKPEIPVCPDCDVEMVKDEDDS